MRKNFLFLCLILSLTFNNLTGQTPQSVFYQAKDLAAKEAYYQKLVGDIARWEQQGKLTFSRPDQRQTVEAMTAFMKNKFDPNIENFNLALFDQFVETELNDLLKPPFYEVDSVRMKGFVRFEKQPFEIYDLIKSSLKNLPDYTPFEFTFRDGETTLEAGDYASVKFIWDTETNQIFDLNTGYAVARYDATQGKALQLADGKAFKEFYSQTFRLKPVNLENVVGLAKRDAEAAQPVPTPANFTASLVDATAQFLVDRVQAELTMTFFEDFKSKIDQSAELQALFPNTLYLLENQNIFHIPTLGEVWKEAFDKDLATFPNHFFEFVQTDPTYAKIAKNEYLKGFATAYKFYEWYQEGRTPYDVLTLLTNELDGSESDEISQVLQFTQLIADALVNYEGSNLISLDAFKKLNRTEAEYFAALLLQQNKPAFNRLTVGSSQLGTLLLYNYNKALDISENFLRTTEQLKQLRENLPKLPATKEAYFNYVLQESETIIAFLDNAFENRYFNRSSEYFKSQYFRQYRPLMVQTFKIMEAAKRKDYSQILLSSLRVFQPLVEQKLGQISKDSLATALSVLYWIDQKAPTATVDSLKIQLQNLQTQIVASADFAKQLLYYGGFIIDIMAAENADQMKGILEKYAEPVGSYRLKRQGKVSLDINAYPGIYAGMEDNATEGLNYGFVTGITAPIGLSVSWGNTLFFAPANGYSTSLFFSVVDIGAAFSYRWTNQTEGFPAEITLKQIFSPGVHLATGFKKSPIALLMGVQYTPALREVASTTADLSPNVWSARLGLCVDISIFNLYAKVEK